MSVFPTTAIPTGIGSNTQFIYLIDNLMTPRLLSFRQIHINDENCELQPDRITWKATFGNWQPTAPLRVRKNGQVLMPAQVTNIDNDFGTFQANPLDLGLDGRPRDTVEVSYVFDYFPVPVIEAFYTAALSIINMTAKGPPTFYTITQMPSNWVGVLTDFAFAMCMERLLLDYDLWRYRLVFAIGPGDVDGSGSSDIVNQITTLKTNAEERARAAMENEKFKTGNYLSTPTAYYYSAIRGLGSMGGNGMGFTGKLQGWKPSKWL